MLSGDPWWGAVVLVRKHAPALNIRRIVRHHTVEYPLDEALPGGRGGPEPFDGVAEVWCDSKGALTQATATPSPGLLRKAPQPNDTDAAIRALVALQAGAKHDPGWLRY